MRTDVFAHDDHVFDLRGDELVRESQFMVDPGMPPKLNVRKIFFLSFWVSQNSASLAGTREANSTLLGCTPMSLGTRGDTPSLRRRFQKPHPCIPLA
ncbi:hypothetical protein GQ600_9295 [Phytophthora cactorum]|nr:hypothetical protein GQ600_9295 [Phytophthora cactorum]